MKPDSVGDVSSVKESSVSMDTSSVGKIGSHTHPHVSSHSGSAGSVVRMSFIEYYLGFMSGDLRGKRDII